MSFMDTVKGWFGKAKENAGEVADKAGDKAEVAWDKTKDVAGDVAGKAGDAAEKAWDKAKDVAGDIKDRFDRDEDEGEAETAAKTAEEPPAAQ